MNGYVPALCATILHSHYRTALAAISLLSLLCVLSHHASFLGPHLQVGVLHDNARGEAPHTCCFMLETLASNTAHIELIGSRYALERQANGGEFAVTLIVS